MAVNFDVSNIENLVEGRDLFSIQRTDGRVVTIHKASLPHDVIRIYQQVAAGHRAADKAAQNTVAQRDGRLHADDGFGGITDSLIAPPPVSETDEFNHALTGSNDPPQNTSSLFPTLRHIPGDSAQDQFDEMYAVTHPGTTIAGVDTGFPEGSPSLDPRIGKGMVPSLDPRTASQLSQGFAPATKLGTPIPTADETIPSSKQILAAYNVPQSVQNSSDPQALKKWMKGNQSPADIHSMAQDLASADYRRSQVQQAPTQPVQAPAPVATAPAPQTAPPTPPQAKQTPPQAPPAKRPPVAPPAKPGFHPYEPATPLVPGGAAPVQIPTAAPVPPGYWEHADPLRAERAAGIPVPAHEAAQTLTPEEQAVLWGKSTPQSFARGGVVYAADGIQASAPPQDPVATPLPNGDVALSTSNGSVVKPAGTLDPAKIGHLFGSPSTLPTPQPPAGGNTILDTPLTSDVPGSLGSAEYVIKDGKAFQPGLVQPGAPGTPLYNMDRAAAARDAQAKAEIESNRATIARSQGEPPAAPEQAPVEGVPPLLARPEAPAPGSTTQVGFGSSSIKPGQAAGGLPTKLPTLPPEVANSWNDYKKATLDNAKITADIAAGRDKIDEQQAKLADQIATRRQADLQFYQDRARETLAYLADPRNDVNPQRLYANASTGERIAAGIGLLLSGFGSPAAHQSNMAMDVIQKAIDRDVDAQKFNRTSKQNLVTLYVQQGHEVNEAARLAKADLLDQTNGLIQRNLNKYAGPQALAQAQQVIAANATKAYTERQGAIETTLRLKALPQQIKDEHDLKALQEAGLNASLYQQFAQLKLQQDAQRALGAQPAPIPDFLQKFAPKGQPVQAPGSLAQGNPMERIIRSQLVQDPSKIPEHYVRVPKVIPDSNSPGGFKTLYDESGDIARDSALTLQPKDEKTKEKIEVWEQTDRALQEWKQFIKDNPNGLYWNPTQQARFKALSKPLVAEATKAAAGRTSAPEIQAFTEAFGDPTSGWNTLFDSALTANNQIQKTHYGELQTILGQNTFHW